MLQITTSTPGTFVARRSGGQSYSGSWGACVLFLAQGQPKGTKAVVEIHGGPKSPERVELAKLLSGVTG